MAKTFSNQEPGVKHILCFEPTKKEIKQIKSIAEALCELTNLKEINFSGCNLDNALIKKFIYGIAKSSSVEKINVSYNTCTKSAFLAVLDLITKHNQKKSILNFKEIDISGESNELTLADVTNMAQALPHPDCKVEKMLINLLNLDERFAKAISDRQQKTQDISTNLDDVNTEICSSKSDLLDIS